jgi:hypothetical protein
MHHQAARTRSVAVRAQAQDAPSAVSRALGVAAASVVAATTLFGGAAFAEADLALGKAVFDGNCGGRPCGGGSRANLRAHRLQSGSARVLAAACGGDLMALLATWRRSPGHATS